jgi:hypothetical protein
MFIAYGVSGLFRPFNLNFWVFYVSLCTITIWIAFKFMSSEKILKYDIITKLTKFGAVKDVVDGFIENEDIIDNLIQPNTTGNTENVEEGD